MYFKPKESHKLSNRRKATLCCTTGYEKGGRGEMKYYWFTFTDGYSVCVRGFSKQELRVEENKHGKLQRKVEA